MTKEHTTFHCDVCLTQLLHHSQSVEIRTCDKQNFVWEHLTVKVHYRSGHNNTLHEDRPADLCQSCAEKMLLNALEVVRRGIRTTAGINESSAQTFCPIVPTPQASHIQTLVVGDEHVPTVTEKD